MPSALAREARRVGIDITTTPEAWLLGASDQDQLMFATAQSRVMVTGDADFAGLHARVSIHCGIVYFPGGRRRPIGELVESLRLVHASYTDEEMVGRLEYL